MINKLNEMTKEDKQWLAFAAYLEKTLKRFDIIISLRKTIKVHSNVRIYQETQNGNEKNNMCYTLFSLSLLLKENKGAQLAIKTMFKGTIEDTFNDYIKSSYYN